MPCHNDIHPDNVIITSEREPNIKLIDWDFSGIGDPFYDLIFALNRFDFNAKEINYGINYYIKQYLHKYNIPPKNTVAFVDSLNAYALTMLPVCNYWCALYTTMKMLNCTPNSDCYNKLTSRLYYYLKKVDDAYIKLNYALYVDPILYLHDIEDHLSEVKKMVNSKEVNIYISGSGAIKILDYIFYEKPIILRDFDITLININPTKKIKYFTTPFLYKIKSKHNKIRMLSKQLKIVGAQYIFQNSSNKKYDYDFTTFNSISLAATNGIFNIDQVLLKINVKENIYQTIEKIRNIGYDAAVKNRLIIDPYCGYISWVHVQPKIINWKSIVRDPIGGIFRVVRTYNKLNLEVPSKFAIKT